MSRNPQTHKTQNQETVVEERPIDEGTETEIQETGAEPQGENENQAESQAQEQETAAEPQSKFPLKAEYVEELRKMPTKSARIRRLAADGFSRTEIVRVFTTVFNDPILYQHVRNVLSQVVKRPVGAAGTPAGTPQMPAPQTVLIITRDSEGKETGREIKNVSDVPEIASAVETQSQSKAA